MVLGGSHLLTYMNDWALESSWFCIVFPIELITGDQMQSSPRHNLLTLHLKH